MRSFNDFTPARIFPVEVYICLRFTQFFFIHQKIVFCDEQVTKPLELTT